MHHPLLSQLQSLSQLLTAHPHLASKSEVVKVLDKIASSAGTVITLLLGLSEGESPEAQELQHLLVQSFGGDESEKNAKNLLKPLLTTIPSRKAGVPLKDYFALLVKALVKSKKTSAATLLIRQHLNRPRFDTSTRDEYELLKQIRDLGRMDAQQKKAAKDHLLKNSDLVILLCNASAIPTTTGKARKPVTIANLVNKLMKDGERYAENAGN